MLEDFCAAEPAPTRDWLTAERAKVTAAIGAPGRKPRRHAISFRWPMPSRIAMVAGAAATAAVTTLVCIVAIPAGHGGTQPQAETAAYVISHTESALTAAAAEDPVVYVHTSDSGLREGISMGGGPFGKGSLSSQHTDAWYYGPDYYPVRYQGFTAAGQPIFDSGVAQNSDTVIDYQARIWWRSTSHITPWVPPHGSALSCDNVGGFGSGSDPVYWPGDIRKLIACGQFTTSGTEKVDGVDAVKISQVHPDGTSAVLWVDPSTYLPVRVTATTLATVSGGNQPERSYRLTETEDLRWLPPTTANLAKLNVPVPSGFVQVPAPPDKDCLGSAATKECLAPWNAWYATYVAPRL